MSNFDFHNADASQANNQSIASRLGLGQVAALFRLLFASGTPTQLLLAPPDLRTADPILAEDIYAGVFTFAAERVECAGGSPFTQTRTSVSWQRDLHGFRWLRHLRSASSEITGTNAKILIADWIATKGRNRDGIAWQADICAHRLISWLSHSVMIVEKSDDEFYRSFMKSIGEHIRYLRSQAVKAPNGLPRLQVRIASAMACLCVDGQKKLEKLASESLGRELARQIYADGGHISRNPNVLPEIMVDLLPLRQTYQNLGIAPPQQMIAAMDRIMPAIRFYRHRDGSFARFNGASFSAQDIIATVLRYDDALGEPTQDATQSGYQRMKAGATTVLMDVGKPPKGELSSNAHAGCLSFEMSALRNSFIVNCGASMLGGAEIREASRSTAAHSTAIINDQSSGRISTSGIFNRNRANGTVTGPGRVSTERRKLDGFSQIIGRHDGYLRQFGVWHERILQLSDDGNLLFGRDRFFVNGGKSPLHLIKDACTIRFHLHPATRAHIVDESGAIMIRAGENQHWLFSCNGSEVGLEESVYFATAGAMQKTSQITIQLHLSLVNEVSWRFEQKIGTRGSITAQ